jgi:hypothetical protein
MEYSPSCSIIYKPLCEMKPKKHNWIQMKNILLAAMVAISAASKAQIKEHTMEKNTSFTCKLTTPELQQRKATVIAELKSHVLKRNESANGFTYLFEASDENLDKLNSFIKTERLCCDFFTFQLLVAGEKILLSITGAEGVKEFIKEEVGL